MKESDLNRMSLRVAAHFMNDALESFVSELDSGKKISRKASLRTARKIVRFGNQILAANREAGFFDSIKNLGKNLGRKIYDGLNTIKNRVFPGRKIKEISFPENEIKNIHNKEKIVTTRVSDDYNKFNVNDIVKTPWDMLYKVTKRTNIDDVSKHPYYRYLTEEQVAFLKDYNRIAVLELTLQKEDNNEKVENQEEQQQNDSQELNQQKNPYDDYFGRTVTSKTEMVEVLDFAQQLRKFAVIDYTHTAKKKKGQRNFITVFPARLVKVPRKYANDEVLTLYAIKANESGLDFERNPIMREFHFNMISSVTLTNIDIPKDPGVVLYDIKGMK